MYTRIVWCCAHVWNVWAISESFNFRTVSHLHELLQHVLPSYSWLKIECLWYCWKFVYQNSLMLCWCVKLLCKIQNVQILSFIFNFALRYSKRILKIEVLKDFLKCLLQNSLMLCLCVRLLGKIPDVQFLSFIFRFCFKKFKKKIENWISQMLLKLWLPE